MQNTPKIVRKLPLLPNEAQILRLRPSSSGTELEVQKEFQRQFRVVRANIENLHYDDIAEMVNDRNCRIHETITRYASKLRGTRPYWKNACSDLEATVQQAGTASVFFTLSAADLQWVDLYQHLPQPEKHAYFDTPPHQRPKLAAAFLQQNPMIVAEWLEVRFRSFLEHVMKKLFHIKEHWYRFEWQARGSGHIHGFFWVEGAPEYTDVSAFLEYWTKFSSALNPGVNVLPAAVHPSSRAYGDRSNTLRELAECLDRFQRHTKCMTSYCKRRDRHTGQDVCRFGFPMPLTEDAVITRRQHSMKAVFEPERNDSILGKYNPTITLGWQANTDFSPCTDKDAVISYLAKYCAKAETKSTKYSDIAKEVLERIPATTRHPIQNLSDGDGDRHEVVLLVVPLLCPISLELPDDRLDVVDRVRHGGLVDVLDPPDVREVHHVLVQGGVLVVVVAVLRLLLGDRVVAGGHDVVPVVDVPQMHYWDVLVTSSDNPIQSDFSESLNSCSARW